MKLTLNKYLDKKKRETSNRSREWELGREEIIKWVKEYSQPKCKECGTGLASLRSKYCKPCSSLVKEDQARKYAKTT